MKFPYRASYGFETLPVRFCVALLASVHSARIARNTGHRFAKNGYQPFFSRSPYPFAIRVKSFRKAHLNIYSLLTSPNWQYTADEEKANKKQGQNFIVSKAPLCKGSCRAKARLRDCEMLRREQKEEREVSNNPSVIFPGKCHLPQHLRRLMVKPV